MKPTEPFHLEPALGRIRDIQALLQDGEQPFDTSLVLFEEAAQLIKKCRTYLRDAEVKLQHVTDNA